MTKHKPVPVIKFPIFYIAAAYLADLTRGGFNTADSNVHSKTQAYCTDHFSARVIIEKVAPALASRP